MEAVGRSSSYDGAAWCNLKGCFPPYFLIGAQKAGTSSVFKFLLDGGHVCTADGVAKEIHFFDVLDFSHPNLQSYRKHFPRESCKNGTSVAFMDATPRNLRTFYSAQRIYKFAPPSLVGKIRFIAIVREPISRDLSEYNMIQGHMARGAFSSDVAEQESVARLHCSVAAGATAAPSYDEAVGCAIDHWRTSCIFANNLTYVPGGGDALIEAYNRCAYGNSDEQGTPVRDNRFAAGMYAPQLKRLTDVFDRKQVLVLQFGRLIAYPDDHLRRIVAFMGMAVAEGSTSLPEVNSAQQYGTPVSSMSCGMREELQDVFRPYNHMLYDLIQFQVDGGKAPEDEPPFPEFDENLVDCHGDKGKSGQRKQHSLIA